MERYLFYMTFFENIDLFFLSMLSTTFLTYISLRKLSIAGILDPLHFFWTFTFGTAYGIVLALYINGNVTTYTFSIIFSYALCLVIFINFFLKIKITPFNRIFSKLFITQHEPKLLYYFVLILFIINTLIIINYIGFGFLAEDNRFEQNRGMGIFVRVFAVFRIFFISYFTLLIYRTYIKYGVFSFTFLTKLFFFLPFIVFTALLDGAKFAFLESILTIVVTLYIVNKNIKISNLKILIITISSLAFALIVYSVNLSNNGLADKESKYIPGTPFVVEALSFRVLANADKYFLSLPNDVIEEVETKPIYIRLLAPVIGSTRLSKMLGYDVNNYSIGKQILLYWHPKFDIAGGPTSHFDLFAYKQLGYLGGFLWVVFTAFILVGIKNLALMSFHIKFATAVFVVLWIRSFPLLIEPPLGLAYILDVFIIFGVMSVIYYIISAVAIKDKRKCENA
ncbi:MAG: Unknown protein [uncultured Sulfurovum sp.]|uniref:Oligosaccharide repeat unit polymerase n=1 Tax=uncultured Sulfurovum sp. TaxID=269237 RepID=A0A6S6TC91_9BACT|nr:MAG: Unknown protein [uncultured Sulfurovum sp.]